MDSFGNDAPLGRRRTPMTGTSVEWTTVVARTRAQVVRADPLAWE